MALRIPTYSSKRQKWTKPRRNFATGDLVLVVDEKVHRGQWPLGRIVQVHPGKDGVVRCDVTDNKALLPRTGLSQQLLLISNFKE